jgi:hypothetical protein
VLFHASQMTSRSVAVRIHHQALPSPWKVEKVDPDEVDVLLRGPRRAFFLLRPEKCGATVRARLREGSQNITLMPDDFSFPDDLAVERVEPQRVKVEVTREPSP